jgi:hypothetical protein
VPPAGPSFRLPIQHDCSKDEQCIIAMNASRLGQPDTTPAPIRPLAAAAIAGEDQRDRVG